MNLSTTARRILHVSLLTLMLVLPRLASARAGGNEVGNGGDLIECRAHETKTSSNHNSFEGLYTLDYLLTESPATPSVSVKTWEESLFRIRQVLATKLPELLVSFDEFANQVFSEDIRGSMVWEKTALSLIEIDDEDIPAAVKIPSNCRLADKISLIQAIIRQKTVFSGTSQIVFKYNSETIDEIKTQRPLQLSYLLVHEWLWTLSDNVERNRRVNHFIHQPDFHQLPRVELLATFSSLGLNIPEIPVVIASDGTGHYTNLDSALQAQPLARVFKFKPGRYRLSNLTLTRPVQLIGEEGAEKTIIEAPSNSPALIFSTPSEKNLIKGLTFLRSASGYSRGIDAYQNAALATEAGSVRIEDCRFGADEFSLVEEISYPGLYARDTHLELVGNKFGFAHATVIYIDANVTGFSESSVIKPSPSGPYWTFIFEPASAKTFEIRDPNVACHLGRFDSLIKCVTTRADFLGR